ncbi:MAG: hypothetical protein IKS13_06595 [Ruminococcus sp.]|nr:hypothetical protein [Ruminococcus sp.]
MFIYVAKINQNFELSQLDRFHALTRKLVHSLQDGQSAFANGNLLK